MTGQRRGETISDWLARVEERNSRLQLSEHVVYRAFDDLGLLLYIGCSSNVQRRMSAHRSSSVWYDYMSSLDIDGPYLTRSSALAAETAAIESESSFFNATRADIDRTMANLNATKRSMVRMGLHEPSVRSEVSPYDEEAWMAAWAEIEDEHEAWHFLLEQHREDLKGGKFPYLTTEDRVARYLGARVSMRASSPERAA